MIEVQGLTKRYGDVRAVSDVSFKLPEGKVVGFLGPNGSGKSTTMRLMLGLDHGGGRTLFDGKRLHQLDSVSRTVGAHLDAKYFHPKRSARNHLRMLAQEGSVSAKRIDELLELFGLTDVAKKAPGGFSLGMGQRLGLAGAILAEPKHLMLDEPANGLDPQSIHWLRDFLREYAAKGNTVFVSSHLLSEMELMADHLVVIAQGKLVTDEPMSQFVSRSTRTNVLLRTDSALLSNLETALRVAGLDFAREGNDGVAVTGADTAAVGRIAFTAQIPVFELQLRRASLEQAFLDATSSHQDYQTGAKQ